MVTNLVKIGEAISKDTLVNFLREKEHKRTCVQVYIIMQYFNFIIFYLRKKHDENRNQKVFLFY